MRYRALTFVIASFLLVSSGHAEKKASRRTPKEKTPPPKVAVAPQQTAEEMLIEADAAYAAGHYAKAATGYSLFLESYALSPQAAERRPRILPLLARAALLSQDGPRAASACEGYLEEYPEGEQRRAMQLWLGLARYMEGDYAQAHTVFAEFMAAYPEAPELDEVRFRCAVCLFQLQKWDAAAPLFAECAKVRDTVVAERAALMELQCRLEQQEAEEAFDLLQALRRRSPPVRQAAMFAMQGMALGDLFLATEQWDRAWNCYLFVPTRARILARHDEVTLELKTLAEAGTKRAATDGGLSALGVKELQDGLARERAGLEKMAAWDVSRYLRVAQAAMRSGRYAEGFLAAKTVAGSQPPGEAVAAGHYLSILAAIELKRWDEVRQEVASFIKRYPTDPRAPQVAYLEGAAQMERRDFSMARETFERHAKTYPSFAEADRVLFLAGYCALFVEDYAKARDHFAVVVQRFPKSPLRETVAYWEAMTAVFSKDYARIRERFGQFIKTYPDSAWVAEARYRIAAADVGEKNYAQGRKNLLRWLKDHPEHALTDEVRALAGDACFGEGSAEEGIALYAQIHPDNTALYEYGQFQIGKALRALGKLEELVAHFRNFVLQHDASPRCVEAFYWTGWALRQLERPEEARTVYREAVDAFGNERDRGYVEDLLLGFARLYPVPEERAAWVIELRSKVNALRREQRFTLAARFLWLSAHLSRKSAPEDYTTAMEELSGIVPKEHLSARILVEAGEYLLNQQRPEGASLLFAELLKRYPKSPLRDRALAGQGLIAVGQGKTEEALHLFDLFEKELGRSPLLPKILQARADIFVAQQRHAEAAGALEKILAEPSAKGLPWVKALYDLGQIHERLGQPRKAAACYERIYVLYGKYVAWVAKAYLARGQVLEGMKLRAEAREVYEEFLQKPELSGTEEFQSAQQRLEGLEG
jgi:TolA-binding protein